MMTSFPGHSKPESTVSVGQRESYHQLLSHPLQEFAQSSDRDALTGPPDSTTKSHGSDFFHSWGWEIASMVGALLCQGAIIGILIWMNDKSLDSWTTLISINSAVAILTTASKSLLLLPVTECLSQFKWSHFSRPRWMTDLDVFDNASRGPLGAVKLLLKKQTLASLASIGAIIILASLAVDPFAQQVIHFDSRLVSMGNNTASFGHTMAYDSGAKKSASWETDCKSDY
jgi:hypothetical protein